MQIRGAVLSLALVPALWVTQSASAGLMTMDPNPVQFDNGSAANPISGWIELVSVEQGVPDGGTVLAGSVSETDITLVFQIMVTEGEVFSVGIGVFDTNTFSGVPSTGAGWIPDNPDWVDITGVSGTAGTRVFTFDNDADGEGNDNGRLGAGETSDLLFVSYSSLVFDGSQFLNFMIIDGGPDPFVSVPLVPGPASLLVLGMGAAALAGRRPRRREA
ncbi:MAG: hypothetical protein ACYTGC_03945 [Planctomycetota bacterium]|jgi:hypothetical protein